MSGLANFLGLRRRSQLRQLGKSWKFGMTCQRDKEAIELMKSGNSGKIVLDWSTL